MFLLDARLFADGGDQSGPQVLFGMGDNHNSRSRWMFEDVM